MKNLIRKIRLWLFYLFAAPAKAHQPRKLQPTEAEDALKITLTDRTEEKRKFMAEWIKPENIAERKRIHEESAAAALLLGQAMARKAREELGLPEPEPLPELPDRALLPPRLKKQQPSTLRKLLDYDRKNKQWIIPVS